MTDSLPSAGKPTHREDAEPYTRFARWGKRYRVSAQGAGAGRGGQVVARVGWRVGAEALEQLHGFGEVRSLRANPPLPGDAVPPDLTAAERS
jgi:hypothetical protein